MRVLILPALVVLVALRLWLRRRGHRRDRPPGLPAFLHRSATGRGPESPVRLVAAREIRERLRSRVLRVGTVVVLLVVAAGVVIPVLHKGHPASGRVGVVGPLSASLRQAVVVAGAEAGVHLALTPEPTEAAADRDLRSGRIALALVDARRIVVAQADGESASTAGVVQAVAAAVALQGGLEAAGLPPARAAALAHPAPLPVTSLEPPSGNHTARATAVYGLILMFVLLTQYGTWILMGVVEEKSSRVVEVLLSTVRAGQLLAGKVVGIGLVALAQGALLVAVALGLASAVGSDLVKGTAPVEVLCVLGWLVLGYVFYCWVYAAAGALAERQEHVQSLAFPLQIPILVGYIVSLTALGSNDPSTLVHVLAYLPPTAPFAMTVLVAAGKVAWWEVAVSAGISVLATVGVARLAVTVYTRAILRTGRRVRLGEVLRRAPAAQGA